MITDHFPILTIWVYNMFIQKVKILLQIHINEIICCNVQVSTKILCAAQMYLSDVHIRQNRINQQYNLITIRMHTGHCSTAQ